MNVLPLLSAPFKKIKRNHIYHTKARNFSSLQSLQTSSGTYPASQVQSSWGVKQTTHLLVVPRLRMSGTIPPLSNMPSGHAQAQLYFYLSF
jgi:hypothetical protein